METNKLEKVQTETTWDVTYNNKGYTVIQMEDQNSNHYSWDIFNEQGNLIKKDTPLTLSIIEYVIENMS